MDGFALQSDEFSLDSTILDFIGNTPLVRLSEKIYAKLEKFNPSGSVKDRPVSYMIRSAIKSGELTKEKIIIDATSGNTGISIAMIAASLGYKATLVMPESMSIERRKIILSYGAEIILTSAEKGMDGAIEKAKQLANEDRYFYLDQFSNGFNIHAHYETTGPEIWEQTNGKITHVVIGIGSGGTIMGISKFLKEKNSNIKTIAVEPDDKSKIQGLKNMSANEVPQIFDFSSADDKITVTQKDAVKMARQLARKGIFVGMSSGAAMWAAKKISVNIENGLIVVIFPDGGEKYLSTKMFNYT